MVMSRRLALSLLIAPLVTAAPASPGSDISAADRAALSEFLRDSVARGDAPAVAAIVIDGERTLFLDAAGNRDAAANDPLTSAGIFRIASMTKPVTSLAVMMLHEQGAIGFDDPVTKYLPEFAGIRVLTKLNEAEGTYEARPPRRALTIRDLLTNTSGIGYAFSDERLARLNDGRKTEADMPLLHDPGEKWTYGPNTAVLGRIIERLSGRTLDEFLRDRIFLPLRMDDTFYVVPPDRRGRVVTWHARQPGGGWTEQPNPETIQSPVRGDGGLFSTAVDYGNFMQIFLNGGRRGDEQLIREASIKMMMSNQIGTLRVSRQPTADPSRAQPFPIGAGKDVFGFGFQIETAPAGAGYRSVGSASWGGIYNTHFWIDPEKQIAAALLMQTLPFYDEAALRVLRGFEREVYRHLR
jgi:methyl acetate hydrolase